MDQNSHLRHANESVLPVRHIKVGPGNEIALPVCLAGATRMAHTPNRPAEGLTRALGDWVSASTHLAETYAGYKLPLSVHRSFD